MSSESLTSKVHVQSKRSDALKIEEMGNTRVSWYQTDISGFITKGNCNLSDVGNWTNDAGLITMSC